MNNHLNQPQKTSLRQYFAKTLILQGFILLKIELLALFALFSPYFRSTNNIPYNKKTRKPLYFLRFKALAFFSLKAGNPLILYMFIPLT